MNYIKQLNAFWQWRSMHKMTHAQADLYLALLSVANENYWKSDLPIPCKKLVERADLCDKSQLTKLRNDLIDMGLITYKAGRGRVSGLYNMVKLYDSGDIYTPNEYPLEDIEGVDSDINNGDFNNKEYNNFNPPYKTYKHINKNINSFYSDDIKAVYDSYVSLCPSLPTVKNLTERRKNMVKNRLQSFTLEQLRTAFQKAEQSSMIRGDIGEWNGAGFDWIVNSDEHIENLLRGMYDDRFVTTPYTERSSDIEGIEKRYAQIYSNNQTDMREEMVT